MIPKSILILHGLNQNVSDLDRIAGPLKERGYQVLIPTLAGHHGDYTEIQSLTAEQMIEDMKGHLDHFFKKEGEKLVIAYSFSVLSLMHHLDKLKDVQLILVAPPFALNLPIHFFRHFPNIASVAMPSFNTPRRRVYSKLPLSLYYQMNRLFKLCPDPMGVEKKVAVILGEGDEIINSRAVLKRIPSHFQVIWSKKKERPYHLGPLNMESILKVIS